MTRRGRWILGGSAVLLLALSILVGRYPTPYFMPPRLLLTDPMAQRLVGYLRLPRLITAMLLGMSLAGAGVVLQMIFRNPLVEPGFLGVSQGAAFGAALAIILWGGQLWLVQISAASFALLGLFASYLLAQHLRYGGWTLRLVLAGIAISALFSSGVGLLKYLADPLTQLPNIVFWTMGSLSSVTWREVRFVAPMVSLSLLILVAMRWRLNLLSLEDETAFSLGVAPGRERALLLITAVVATATMVSLTGIVGWVGLIVPHLARRLTGADSQRVLPLAMILGALYTLVCDNLARTLLAGEIPLGIFTSFIGALGFVVLLGGKR